MSKVRMICFVGLEGGQMAGILGEPNGKALGTLDLEVGADISPEEGKLTPATLNKEHQPGMVFLQPWETKLLSCAKRALAAYIKKDKELPQKVLIFQKADMENQELHVYGTGKYWGEQVPPADAPLLAQRAHREKKMIPKLTLDSTGETTWGSESNWMALDDANATFMGWKRIVVSLDTYRKAIEDESTKIAQAQVAESKLIQS